MTRFVAGPSVVLLGLLAWGRVAAAQDPTAVPSGPSFFRDTEISGLVDVYYGFNRNRPDDGQAQLRNFDLEHDAFSLQLVELALGKVPSAESRGGFRIDLDYGPVARTVHAAEPGDAEVFQHLEQAYASFLAPVGKGWQLDVGKFVTPHGAEVIESKDNWNYSRSLLFALAIPYYHMGARLSLPLGDRLTLGASLVNGWNNVVDNNSGKSVGLQATWKPVPALTVIQNYMGGREQAGDDRRHLFDTVVTYSPSSRWSFLLNYDHGQDRVGGAEVRWQGLAAYARFQPRPWLALAPRLEWYEDRDGLTTGAAQTLKGVTFTAELKHQSGFLVRLEYRRDGSDEPSFLKRLGTPVDSQSTFTVGVLYSFSSKS